MRAYGENTRRGSLDLCHPLFTHLSQSLGFGIRINHDLAFTFFKTMLIRHMATENSQLRTIGIAHTVLSIVIQLHPPFLELPTLAFVSPLTCRSFSIAMGPATALPSFSAGTWPQLLGPSPSQPFSGAGCQCMCRPVPSFESPRSEHHCPFLSVHRCP